MFSPECTLLRERSFSFPSAKRRIKHQFLSFIHAIDRFPVWSIPSFVCSFIHLLIYSSLQCLIDLYIQGNAVVVLWKKKKKKTPNNNNNNNKTDLIVLRHNCRNPYRLGLDSLFLPSIWGNYRRRFGGEREYGATIAF